MGVISIISKIKQIIEENRATLLKFVILGGLATVLNFSVFLILLNILGLHYLISASIGYISGVFIGFGLNRRFTFKSESKKHTLEMMKYLLVYSGSLFFGLVLLSFFVIFGIDIILAYIIVMGCTTITNYTGTRFFVFYPIHIVKKLDYWFYRYRYLSNYIVIGLGSLFLEFLFLALMEEAMWPILFKTVGAFIFGMLFSFLLNSKLNFKVPKEKNLRTLKMFTLISVFAFVLNFLLINYFFQRFLLIEYSITRFISAGCIFLISYTLHRRFTFTDVKEVGIAIYLSEVEDIQKIVDKVSYYPDWIHLDLVDNTFNSSAKAVDLTKGYHTKKHWPNLKTMTHIMSKMPSLWVDKVEPFSDYIIIHSEISEPVDDILDKIKKSGRKPGISITPGSSVKDIEPYLDKVDIVQILGIAKPGESGQHLDAEALKKLDLLNDLKKRNKYKFNVCFDGGVKLSNIGKIDAKYIVSGSTVLKSEDVTKAIYALKTSSRYYYEHGVDLKKFLKKKILETLEGIDFVQSGTLVGSFVESEGVEGIGDIDIIVILNQLTKPKFDKVVSEFKKLGPILKTDYHYDLHVNTTFGPLKYNKDKTVVFHLMIYDVDGHTDHCIKSPFTCLDWQRSKHFVKSSMSNIWSVSQLQPNYFFNARRSVNDYIKDLRSSKISYREYQFGDRGIKELKKSKQMDNKDKFEFSYHIMKFCMANFLKLYNKENNDYNLPDLVEHYSRVFPENKETYYNYLVRVKGMKDSNNFPEWKKSNEQLLFSFLKDFEEQFKTHFDENAVHLYFVRHQKTSMNAAGLFLGQRNDPRIIESESKDVKNLIKELKKRNISEIYSSPLKRCLQTVGLVKEDIGVSRIIVDDSLKEIDYGEIDGKPYSHLKNKYPSIINGWEEKKDPKFPKGENTADVLRRVEAFLASFKDPGTQRSNSIVCTHNVFLRCLVGKLFNIPMHQWHMIDIPHLDPLEVVLTKEGKFYLNLTPEQRDKLFKKVVFTED